MQLTNYYQQGKFLKQFKKRWKNLSETSYREMYHSEALEHVDIMNQALLKLEESPDIKEHVDLIFRSAHTIKGMAATMGYDQTKELCKNIENVFDKIRKKQLMLEHPEESHPIENTESMSIAQLPTIRVKMSDLDSLVNLVGELIISKMKLENSIKEEGSVKSKTSLLDLGRLVTDLQYQSLKLRLVPIDTIFRRFERVVRDTSNQLGKKAQLQMEGAKIELDRTILDAITDPLLHILRNCVEEDQLLH